MNARARLASVLKAAIDGLDAIIEQSKAMKIPEYTQDKYERDIDQAAGAYWKDGVRGSFITRMRAAVKFGLTDAFTQGARDVGVERDEFDDETKQAIADIIAEEQSHITTLLDYVDQVARSKQPQSALDMRLGMWKSRYQDVVDRARVMLGGKTRLGWKLGQTEEHCETCSALNGLVAFAEEWERAGIYPRRPPNDKLVCKGYQCDCTCEPTKRRRSARAFERIQAIAEGM